MQRRTESTIAMKRRHDMPFGAQLMADEAVRFRLWAPAARQVELHLEGAARLPMTALAEGWYELVTRDARAGSRYRFRIDGEIEVPDPASRFNPDDVHGASQVIDPDCFEWDDAHWRGRPWEEAAIYELHVGAFSAEGSFAAVEARLDDLADLGITAIELMPLADFAGRRNWGYDGVLPFAPDASYGDPGALKSLVCAAHRKGLMVLLDVVCNHFGPEGNDLGRYAPAFFSDRHRTPWGPAIDFDRPHNAQVRDFFIHNALYWLEEYHFDGLRLDAVDAIVDRSHPHIVEALAAAVHAGPGRHRHVHLVLENDANAAHRLRGPDGCAAQWNDDFHHAMHVLLTGETDGCLRDYAHRPAAHLARCLAEGFAYQGEPSPCRGGRPRGEPSRTLPPTAFVNCLQSHDQVGNRAFGERLSALAEPAALRAALAVLLLAPSPPLLFMGEEFGADTPFHFFCDFPAELGAAVRAGRRSEIARRTSLVDPDALAAIPDPNDPATFERSRLRWDSRSRAQHAQWLRWCAALLALRQRQIVPRLHGISGGNAGFRVVGRTGLIVNWHLGDGSRLALVANLGAGRTNGFERPIGEVLFAAGEDAVASVAGGALPPWGVLWFIDDSSAAHTAHTTRA